ncbi:DNA topoisomerase I [archaeon]|nr:DNA topoisomerase I [archaeon]
MVMLIIAEKPSASKKIAEALAESKVERNTYMKKVSYYEIQKDKEKIYVVCAVGHLYNLAEKNKKGWTYPVFDIEWRPSHEISQASKFTKPYLNLIKKLAKESKKFIVATDYDVEGEVIGYNVVKYACGKEDAERMKFSTTTKEDLLKAYEKREKHMDLGQAMAGETRHILDWSFGINLSRALTLSVKNATGMFKVLSSGRVQGPALKLLTKRELSIKKFVPVPFWEIELFTNKLNAGHEKGRFDNRNEAEEIVKKCKGKKVVVEKVTRKKFKQDAPNPFDLTSLQMEVYRVFRIQPKECLSIAQELYTNSYISYPRTSSNQLNDKIGYKKIFGMLAKQKWYKPLCDELVKGKLKPNNGKKSDPAHPAIYPTGEVPQDLKEREKKVYDLIVKRFMATFADAAVKETVNVKLDVNEEKFLTKGTRTLEENWHKFYEPYVKKDDVVVDVEEKEDLDNKKIELYDKETQPPRRYTPASIIKELEKRDLGTKATRAEIIEHLFKRDYLKRNGSIEVTNLGIETVGVLEKYCSEILDEELTRGFEEDMEKIRKGKVKEEKVLDNAQKFLTKVLKKFKSKEKEIGKELADAFKETQKEESFIMPCKCGGDLKIKYSPKNKSYFIACSKYPDCTITHSLPKGFLAKSSDKKCKECGFPEVLLIKKGKRPWPYCINYDCPQKVAWRKSQGR